MRGDRGARVLWGLEVIVTAVQIAMWKTVCCNGGCVLPVRERAPLLLRASDLRLRPSKCFGNLLPFPEQL